MTTIPIAEAHNVFKNAGIHVTVLHKDRRNGVSKIVLRATKTRNDHNHKVGVTILKVDGQQVVDERHLKTAYERMGENWDYAKRSAPRVNRFGWDW